MVSHARLPVSQWITATGSMIGAAWQLQISANLEKRAAAWLRDSRSLHSSPYLPLIVRSPPQPAASPLCLARSTGGNITMFNGNQLLAPLNCIQWTGQYGDARSIYVASAPPDPKLFNADMAAQAFFDHLQGTALLPADMLQKGESSGGRHAFSPGKVAAAVARHSMAALGLPSRTVWINLYAGQPKPSQVACLHLSPRTAVTSNVKTAIESTSFTWATPASSPSAALWASFGSQLDVQLSNTAAGWTCGSVDASSPANKIAVRRHAPGWCTYVGRAAEFAAQSSSNNNPQGTLTEVLVADAPLVPQPTHPHRLRTWPSGTVTCCPTR